MGGWAGRFRSGCPLDPAAAVRFQTFQRLPAIDPVAAVRLQPRQRMCARHSSGCPLQVLQRLSACSRSSGCAPDIQRLSASSCSGCPLAAAAADVRQTFRRLPARSRRLRPQQRMCARHSIGGPLGPVAAVRLQPQQRMCARNSSGRPLGRVAVVRLQPFFFSGGFRYHAGSSKPRAHVAAVRSHTASPQCVRVYSPRLIL